MMRVVGGPWSMMVNDGQVPTCLVATCSRHVFWVMRTGALGLLYYYSCLDTSPSALFEACQIRTQNAWPASIKGTGCSGGGKAQGNSL